MRTAQDYPVPPLRLTLKEAPHSSPGFVGIVPGSIQQLPSPEPYLLVQADNPSGLGHVNDDSGVDSIACPFSALFDGIPGRIPRDRLLPPALRIEGQSLPQGVYSHLYDGGAGIAPVRRGSYQRSVDLSPLSPITL
jgi:hypothetical protein